MLLARINVTLKPTVNDPQGLAIRQGLHSLGFHGVDQVRAGKHLEIYFQETDVARARVLIDEMCQSLLVNTIIERYDFELEELESDINNPLGPK